MKKAGRPQLDNARIYRKTIRFTETEFKQLEEVSKKKNKPIAELVREALKQSGFIQ